MIQAFTEIVAYRATTHPQRIALVSNDIHYSYKELYDTSLQVANWLYSQNIVKGDHIALLDFNTADIVHFSSGCLLAGVIPVAVNWRLTPNELIYIIQDAGCKIIVYASAFQPLVNDLLKEAVPPVVEFDFVMRQISNQHLNTTNTLPVLSMEDQALLIYTSGTTGNPKGVMLSHRNIFEMNLALRSETPLFGPASVNLIAGPWFAVVGIGYFIFGIYTGCVNVLLKIFDPLEMLRLINTYRVTNTFMAPVMMKIICSMEEVHDFDLSSLQNIQYGGSPIEESQLRNCYSIFNCNFTQGYGLTETSGIATALRFDDHLRIMGSDQQEDKQLLQSAGKPYPGIYLKIINEENMELPIGLIGEICIKGNTVASGYKNALPEDKIFEKNGWFHTGDIGYINKQGFVFLVDRKSDMILSKGQNIYPAEVERILQRHPQIKEVAAIGVPHDIYGEAVAVVVVLKSGTLEINSLRNWAHETLPDFKLPVLLEIRDELPRNATGKIVRKMLREKYWQNKTRRIN